MLENLIDNVYLIVAAVAVGGCLGFMAHSFVLLPKSLKMKLLYQGIKQAVIKAEEYFGSKTGTAKLYWAWESLRFLPFVGGSAHKLITFEEFQVLVRKALVSTGIWAEDKTK